MRSLLLLVTAVAFVGCAAGNTLTRRDVLRQYDQIAKLSTSVSDAAGQDAALLAPESFEHAKRLLDQAVAQAQDADKAKADATAEQGLKAIETVTKQMAIARDEMHEVLTTRQRALQEGAEALLKQEFEEADLQLKSANTALASKRVDEAREQRPALMERYAAMELEAIKRGVIEGAQTVVEQANEAEAADYAPRTMAEAQEELRLTRAMLESDRRQRNEAEQHARKAIWLAGRAMAIADLAKMFEREEYGLEDIVLWHQSQLAMVNEPLSTSLPFNESDRAAVHSLRKSISSLLQALADARDTSRRNDNEIAVLEKKLNNSRSTYESRLSELAVASGKQLEDLKTQYETQLSAEALKQQEAERQRAAREQRFARVEALFSPSEATVSRNGENVRIDVYGFDFAPGKETIGSANFGLLDRLVSAVRTFPDSRVRVSGHTDSVGSDARNLQLSIDRAAAVHQFLVEIGKIAADRVESDGFGESKPVAPNTSKEGRAKNRRVEILIVNQSPGGRGAERGGP